jgi:hypothetical protein
VRELRQRLAAKAQQQKEEEGEGSQGQGALERSLREADGEM